MIRDDSDDLEVRIVRRIEERTIQHLKLDGAA